MCFCTSVVAKSQQTLVVRYEVKTVEPLYTLMGFADSATQLIFFPNDSIKIHAEHMLRDSLFKNSTYYNIGNNEHYDGFNYPYAQGLIVKPNTDGEYTNTGRKEIILGYTCTKYTCTTTRGDKLAVWSTDSIGNFYSKIHAPNAPGVVLQMSHWIKRKKITLTYRAVGINFLNVPVHMPAKEPVISYENFKLYLKRKGILSDYNINPNAVYKPGKNSRVPRPVQAVYIQNGVRLF